MSGDILNNFNNILSTLMKSAIIILIIWIGWSIYNCRIYVMILRKLDNIEKTLKGGKNK